MSWTRTPKGNLREVAVESGVVLPSSATTEYGSLIDFVAPGPNSSKNVSVLVVASAVSGTNLDIALYGAMTPSGSKFLLKDAVVADVTNAAKVQGGVVDLNAYPAPYYFIGWTSDADEHLNTVAVSLYY